MDQSTTVKKIPLILVTGFLGSGKTSLLKQILKEIGSSRKIAIVQNEFAPGRVDSVELQASGVPFDLLEINNGSVFCACLLDDFISRLAEFIRTYQPEAIFLEATGLADPVSLAQVMQTPEVTKYIFLGGVWTVVDCLNFDKSHQYIQRVRHQIQIADIILLNKTDLAPPEDKLINQLLEWNPFAQQFRTQDGLFEELNNVLLNSLDLQYLLSQKLSLHREVVFPAKSEPETEGSLLKPFSLPRPDIGSCVIRSQKIFTEQSIRQFHSENKGYIYRMKGYVRSTEGKYLLIQSVFDHLEINYTDHWSGPTELILMGPGVQPGAITREFLKSGKNG